MRLADRRAEGAYEPGADQIVDHRGGQQRDDQHAHDHHDHAGQLHPGRRRRQVDVAVAGGGDRGDGEIQRLHPLQPQRELEERGRENHHQRQARQREPQPLVGQLAEKSSPFAQSPAHRSAATWRRPPPYAGWTPKACPAPKTRHWRTWAAG
nr:hypothetical protein [Fodinicola feengrottensis]